MKCKRASGDDLMKALVKQGINIVLPPRDHIEAGSLILADPDDSIRPGSWQAVLNVALAPETKADGSFNAFSFQAASNLSTDASATLLGSVLQKFGLASGGFKSAFSAAKAATIELTLVAPANQTLHNFDDMLSELNHHKAEPGAAYQEKRFFVVTKVWRARGLRLRVLDKSNRQLELTAQAMENLQASTSLAIKREDNGSYVFVAAEPQIFGVTLREIVALTDTNGNTVIGDRPSKEHMTFRNDAEAEYAFIGEEAFLDLPEV